MQNLNQGWGAGFQTNKPFNRDWLGDFASQANKNSPYAQPKNQLADWFTSGSQKSMRNFDAGGYGDRADSGYPAQNFYKTEEFAPMGGFDAPKNQLAAYMSSGANNGDSYRPPTGSPYEPVNPSAANQYQAPDTYDFTDEGGDVYKMKKPNKPAYDWSMDFG